MSDIIKKPENESERLRLIDEYIIKLRGTTNPLDKPKWSLISWIYYCIGFPFLWTLTLLFCIEGWILACYGWIKLKRKSKTIPNLLATTTIKRRKNQIYNSISIIVPCYNETESIEAFMLFIEKNCNNKNNIEIILIDGKSTDNWWNKLNDIKHLISIKYTIIKGRNITGRGYCINEGYNESSGDILLFLHTDSIVSKGFDDIARKICNKPNVVIGSYNFTVDRSVMKFPIIGLGCMELFARIRNYCFWLPYGDQGYFIARDMYELIGGFPNVFIGEDLKLTNNAREFALNNDGIIHVDNMNLYCSPKRWEKNGVAYNTFWNQYCVFRLVYSKWNDKEIYKLYYGVELK